MTSLYMVFGGVVVFVAVIWILVAVSKKAGSATTKADSLSEGESRREAFDEATSRPVATGNELIDRMRDLGR